MEGREESGGLIGIGREIGVETRVEFSKAIVNTILSSI
jgi:hypothetical protein